MCENSSVYLRSKTTAHLKTKKSNDYAENSLLIFIILVLQKKKVSWTVRMQITHKDHKEEGNWLCVGTDIGLLLRTFLAKFAN